MKIYSTDENINITQSVLKYLNDTWYYRHDTLSGTLSTYYPNVSLTIGFPSDLEQMSLPMIAINPLSQLDTAHLTYSDWTEKFYPYRIDLFCGGEITSGSATATKVTDERKNLFMRDRMMNDVKNLLDANVGYNHIDLYNYSDIIFSGTSYKVDGDIYIDGVSATPLEPFGSAESDRFRGLVDFTASIIYSQY